LHVQSRACNITALSIAQFLSDRFSVEQSRYREYISSFAAAIAITYLLLVFLPEAYRRSPSPGMLIPLLFGFALIHFLEKGFYQKFKRRFSLPSMRSYHDELHAFTLLIYHFVVGALLIRVLQTSLSSGILLLLPLLLFTTIGNWSVHHEYLQQRHYIRTALALSTIMGALFITFLKTSTFYGLAIETGMINFAAGMLIFIVVRESLPERKEGKPLFFFLGITLYTLILLILHALA
jgi:hypothetical protein